MTGKLSGIAVGLTETELERTGEFQVEKEKRF